VIGAQRKGGATGAAYVFVCSAAGAWSQQAELTAPDGAEFAYFGNSVSVSGNTAVIGAEGKAGQGAAYVFVLGAGGWGVQQEMTDPGGLANDNFGVSVSVSGGTVAVGAYYESVLHSGAATPAAEQGAVYMYTGPVLGTGSLVVGSAAGASSVALSMPSDAAWTAAANDSFLHVSPGSDGGVGSSVVVFTYDAFTGTGTRTGTLTIAGLPVTVTQAGTNYMGPVGPSPLFTLISGVEEPGGVAVDGFGNVWDTGHHYNNLKEWQADGQGVIQWLTGADSGLSAPWGLAVDNSGNVYIADLGNGAIKEWNPVTGQVTTLASPANLAPWGVAVDSFGNVYFSDFVSNLLYEWSAATGQVTTLVSSGLNSPTGLAVDVSGDVYIADMYNDAIKQWSPATGLVTTLVSSSLLGPNSTAVDGSCNVYIADDYDEKIFEWSAATGQFTTVASPAMTSPALFQPEGVAVDGAGNVYIADWGSGIGSTNGAIEEIPYAFVGPATLSEPATSGSDSLLPVLPATANLTGIFAPTAQQSSPNWLTIEPITSAVVKFTFTANSGAARTATISILGETITVTQNGSLTQTIDFTQPPPQTYGTTYNLVATATPSGLTVSFSATPADSGICSVAGTTVSFQSAGTCYITAAQPGNNSYAAATPVTLYFGVMAASQTITFGTAPAPVYGGGTVTVSATASSGLPVSFSVAAASSGVCSVSGSTVTPIAAGSCTIVASQAGNTNYLAATPVNQTFTVAQASQSIAFGTLSSQPAGVAFTLSATASSGLAVMFSSTTPSYCTVSGSTVTPVAVGTCTIQAAQAGNANYAAATAVSQNFNVTQGSQTIEFAELPPQVYGTAPFAVLATASSGLAVSFSASPASVCTVSVSTVTLTGVGVCTIQATVAATTNYAAATASRAFEVQQASQTITFLPLQNVAYGATVPALSASSSSGLSVAFAATASSAGVCTVAGTAVTLVGVGVCGIVATVAATTNYAAATPVTQGFLVTQASQTITFVGPANQVFGATVPALSATAGVGMTVTFTSLSPGICLVSGATVTLVSVGTCYIQATQPGNANYAAATAVTQNFSVTQGSQTITFGTAPAPVYGGGPVQVSATATSGLPVSFNSETTGVCTVAGATVTPIAGGACTIQATQAGNTNYAAATAVTQTFQVAQASQSISFGTLSSQAYGTTPPALSASASSGLAVSFASVMPGDTGICSVSGTTVTLLGLGTCWIQATQAGNANYAAAPSASQSFSVTLGSQTITFAPLSNKPFGSAPFTVSAQASSGLAVSFSSATPAVCTVSGSTVTLGAIGLCTIVASQPGNADYQQASPVSESFLSTGGTVTLAVVNSGATAGQSLQVPIQLTSTGTDSPSTFQADLGFDTTKLTFVSATAGTPLTNAGKTLSVNSLGSGSVRILAEGQNQTGISNGAAAYATFTLSAAFTTGSTTVTAGNCSASDGSGNALSVTCTAGTIRPMVCDINGDGNINVVDVQLEINEALGVAPALNDMNGDGVVNVVDVQIVINAALGLGCTY
jgi:sugar lactone lactonase YvrE